jgi:hypothetical protein
MERDAGMTKARQCVPVAFFDRSKGGSTTSIDVCSFMWHPRHTVTGTWIIVTVARQRVPERVVKACSPIHGFGWCRRMKFDRRYAASLEPAEQQRKHSARTATAPKLRQGDH